MSKGSEVDESLEMSEDENLKAVVLICYVDIVHIPRRTLSDGSN